MNTDARKLFLSHASGFDKDQYNREYYDQHKAWKKRYNKFYYMNNKDKWGYHGTTTTTTTTATTTSPSVTDRTYNTSGRKTTTTQTTSEATPEKRKKYLPERILDTVIQLTPGVSALFEDAEDFIRSFGRLTRKIDEIFSSGGNEISDGKEYLEGKSFDFSKIRAKFDEYDQKVTAAKNKYNEVTGKIRDFFTF